MRRLTIALMFPLTLAAPALAQEVTFPTLTMPEPGTFCGPLQLCTPLVTQDVQQ
ncbi:hypothetical protein K3728_14545 [Rhodobacteraceae bacterium M385]|nr:hypothetical protein K3728_14545 [Rhodobacteraceae bacterium M385]